MIFLRSSLIFVVLIVAATACKKEPVINPGSYTGQFYGWNTSQEDYPVFETDVPFEFTNIANTSVTVNDSSILSITKDSIQGYLYIPGSTYFIQPYIIGTWTMEDKKTRIDGHYGALKDTTESVTGYFEIVQD